MTKPTEAQIIEAAKECGARFAPLVWEDGMQQMFKTNQLYRFAMHFYKQGLLDAAEKCVDIATEDDPDSNHTLADSCAEALRAMAEEVGK
jgi:hypothetical protein